MMGIFISQDKYVDEILKKFGFSTVKTASTPMETSKPLMKDENAEDVDVHLYRSMIGSLMYLTSSMPDIMFDNGTTANDGIQVSDVGLTYYLNKRAGGIKIDDGNLAFGNELRLKWYSKVMMCALISSDGRKLVLLGKTVVSARLLTTVGTVTPLFPSMLASQVVVGEGSGQPSEPQHTPTTAPPSHSSGPTTLVADETVYEERGDSVERAATTAASLDVEQDSDAQNLEKLLIKKSVKKLGRNGIDQDKEISWFQEDVETHGMYGHDFEVNTTSTLITTASINITTAEPVTTTSALLLLLVSIC
ncbi:hypothetical protein Tco_1578553 [Tanacetum coccineum]